ncbi:CYFA0S13e00518g1_1 [Cyberlindnera fabianii]|uniref:CYFA0S13e00518g1_1 n=1 Tax=Cyberlindnera fabianii TaxID=36022 RepID=A0A061B362_CYBFA|nr:putative aminoacrylate hydrolase RutD [Cyberlindnera fabianii]CDR43905.1 CYFA0S13e00518g1_1 [Cyberlindnera fabianii]
MDDPLHEVPPIPESQQTKTSSQTEDIQSPQPQSSQRPAVLNSGRHIGDPERQPLLSPDDPGVSALNVTYVRLSRFALNVLSFLSTILLVLLLISDFVSIPGFNNRGRSFLEINFVLISLFSTASSLILFQVPSALERQLGYINAGLVAFILILLVAFDRSSMTGVGLGSALWCLLTILFTSVSEYFVEQGKEHEEIRLTGRIETRRTLTEWFVVLLRNTMKSILIAFTALVTLNVLLHTFDVIRVKPWGEQVWVEDDSFTLHVACYGDVHNSTASDQPIILLQGGHGSSEEFSEWVEELHHLNQIERYCIYDRPGYGFSDSSPSPISLSIVSDLLTEALHKLKVDGPFLVAGHDIGGLYSMVFASRNQARVESLLLVDSWHEDLLLRNPVSRAKKDEPLPVEISHMGPSAGFSLWIRGIFSPLGLALQGSWIFKHHGSRDRIYGRDMRHQGRYLRARLQEQVGAGILSYNEAINAKPQLTDIPISVVSSDGMIKKSLNWGNWQRQLTKISSVTYEWKIADGGHEVWKTPKGREQLQDVLLRLVEK